MSRLALALVLCVLLAVSCADVRQSRGIGRRSYSRSSSSRRSQQAIIFRGNQETKDDADFEKANAAPGIPLSLANSFSLAQNINDLESLVDRPRFMKYDVQQSARSARPGGLGQRFGTTEEDNGGNRNGEMAIAATCKPEVTTVPITGGSKAPNAIYWPSCTRVKRCGGCCSHELLACKPTASRTIHVQVIAALYEGGANSQVRYTGAEMVELEVHTACECGCKLSQKDCNQYQEYVASECRCKCTNKDHYQKCIRNEDKLWEPSTCRCKCKTQRECSTGHFFDLNSCQCSPIPQRVDRPFDMATRFYTPFQEFYNTDSSSSTPVVNEEDQSARHAEPAQRSSSGGRQVRVRGAVRSDRYDQREQRS